MDFEWDDQKSQSNYVKHSVRFVEAATIWLDGNSLEIPDAEHSISEERWIRLGTSQKLRILIVVFIEKIENKKIRIISARKANKEEQSQYLKRISYEE